MSCKPIKVDYLAVIQNYQGNVIMQQELEIPFLDAQSNLYDVIGKYLVMHRCFLKEMLFKANQDGRRQMPCMS